MSFLDSCVKYLVFIVNLILFICGMVVVGVASFVFINAKSYKDFLGGGYMSGPSILIAVGVFIALVSFLGCCGAAKENSCMMYTHATIITLLLIIELGAAIASIVYKKDVKNFVSKAMRAEEARYGDDKEITEAWDSIQKSFKCCGVEMYTDWRVNSKMNSTGSVPDSCCLDTDIKDCGKGALNSPDPEKKIHTEGCVNAFVDSVKSHYGLVGGIAAGVCLLQLITIVISCCLGKKMSQKDHFTV